MLIMVVIFWVNDFFEIGLSVIMKIVHLGSSDLAHANGGVASAVFGYIVFQAKLKHEILLFTTGDVQIEQGVNVQFFPYLKLLGSKFQWSLPLFKALQNEPNVQIIHNHGLWRFPNIYPGFINKKKAKIICSPHGVFSPWALNYSALKKKITLFFLGQRRMLEAVDMFHATCEEEYLQIRSQKLLQPVMVVANGVDIPEIQEYTKNKEKRRVVFLGRIHPIKGLDFLLQSWCRVAADKKEWELCIVGPNIVEDYAESLATFLKEQRINNVRFLGSINGLEKQKLLAESDYLVLTSHSENFAMVVAEALAHALPVIVTEGVPWEKLNSKGCGWWVPRKSNSFDAALTKAIGLTREESSEMGALGREWVKQDFSVESVAIRLVLGYEWICKGGEKPEFVKVE
ncbi:MAG: hypothetical protein methR_P1475 [Methyloprofundus sp.]|nr:MAG: hypothetical protein methR_P1475 [Methyloprofundus sp.]